MTVPNKKLILGATTILISGASFTLAHHSGATPSSHANTSIQLNTDEPSLSTQGVVENPPVNVNIDGTPVSVGQGTTNIPTKNGSAKVTVLGKSVSVEQTRSQAPGNPGSSLNVNVQSTSIGGGGAHVSFQSSSNNSKANSSSFSQTSVFSNGVGSVNVQTNQ
jgi:hypothetical protein